MSRSMRGDSRARIRGNHPGRMAGTATIDPMAETPSSAELPASLTVRRGRIVFRARRPVALVLPLLAVTEIAGVICLLNGATIGWFIIAAPLIGLATTAVILRPALELTRDGLVQRQYPYSSLTRWDVIDSVRHRQAGNRVILAYKLVPDVPPPRHQPARICCSPSTPRTTEDGSPIPLPVVRRGARSRYALSEGAGASSDAAGHTSLRV